MDDLFGDIPQPERQSAAPERRPLTPEDVRAKMVELIAIARAAETMPFASAEFDKHIAMFPIMAQWLPEADGRQLVLEFEIEVLRLRRAA